MNVVVELNLKAHDSPGKYFQLLTPHSLEITPLTMKHLCIGLPPTACAILAGACDAWGNIAHNVVVRQGGGCAVAIDLAGPRHMALSCLAHNSSTQVCRRMGQGGAKQGIFECRQNHETKMLIKIDIHQISCQYDIPTVNSECTLQQ